MKTKPDIQYSYSLQRCSPMAWMRPDIQMVEAPVHLDGLEKLERQHDGVLMRPVTAHPSQFPAIARTDAALLRRISDPIRVRFVDISPAVHPAI